MQRTNDAYKIVTANCEMAKSTNLRQCTKDVRILRHYLEGDYYIELVRGGDIVPWLVVSDMGIGAHHLIRSAFELWASGTNTTFAEIG